MKTILVFFVALSSPLVFAKRPLSVSTASIYTDDFAVNDDGTVNLNSSWKSLSQETNGATTSKLYEKKAPEGNNIDLYGVEVKTSKDTGIKSVTSFAGYKGENSSERISYVSYDEQGNVSSSTLCWDKKSCITINDRFCSKLMLRTGAKTAKDLAQQQQVCKTLSSEFDDVFQREEGLGPEILKIQKQNFKEIVNGQLSKKLMPSSAKDFFSRYTNSDAPRPGASLNEQMQIGEALQACAHYASTGQFRHSDTVGETTVVPTKKSVR